MTEADQARLICRYAPVATPFSADEEIDFPAFNAQVLRLAKAGMGLVVLGTNGEASHLSDDERVALIASVRKTLDDNGFSDRPLLAGTGTGSAKQTIALCRAVRSSLLPATIYVALLLTSAVYACYAGERGWRVARDRDLLGLLLVYQILHGRHQGLLHGSVRWQSHPCHDLQLPVSFSSPSSAAVLLSLPRPPPRPLTPPSLTSVEPHPESTSTRMRFATSPTTPTALALSSPADPPPRATASPSTPPRRSTSPSTARSRSCPGSQTTSCPPSSRARLAASLAPATSSPRRSSSFTRLRLRLSRLATRPRCRRRCACRTSCRRPTGF